MKNKNSAKCLYHPERPVKAKGLCSTCYTREIYRQRPEVRKANHDRVRTPKGRFTLFKGGAKARGLTVTIDLESFSILIVQPCFYCGNGPETNETGSGLDRIDNTEGYHLLNVIPCCGQCNTFRSDKLSVGETLCLVQALLEYRKSL